MVSLKKLIQSGNSVAVVLDKELLEAAGLEAGATVEIDVSDGLISIGKSRHKRAALAIALVFLELNGVEIVAADAAVIDLVLRVATGAASKSEVAVFFEKHVR
jgi:antitoxin component of MazEF toxin-antitoxin module